MEKTWYAEGLRFKCTECGQCCTGSPGYAWVTEEEIEAIANYLSISKEKFCQKYIRIVDGRFSLIEQRSPTNPKDYDCVFLKDKKCQVYPVRPKQCRTFPWWPINLKSPKDRKEAARFCEGISTEAPVVAFQKIDEQLKIQEGK